MVELKKFVSNIEAAPAQWPITLGMSQITQGWVNGEQQKFFSRIGSWFRRNNTPADEEPMAPQEVEATDLAAIGENEIVVEENNGQESNGNGRGNHEPESNEPRLTFLRPWARRDQAIDNLNRGLGALSDLLISIRENMQKQGERQEHLLSHLSELPAALRAIPEAGRLQGETLKAIQQQIEKQTLQQSQLGQVLDRISQADTRHGRTLEALQQNLAAINQHDQAISFNLQTLGIALESVSQNSATGAKVLEQLRDNSARRDGELERVVKRHNTRFTTMLTIAIVLSMAALTAVSVFGYVAYDALTKMK